MGQVLPSEQVSSMQKNVLAGLLGAVSLGLTVFLVGCAYDLRHSAVRRVDPDQVGRVAASRYVTPTGQVLTPAGTQVELPGMRPQALAMCPEPADTGSRRR